MEYKHNLGIALIPSEEDTNKIYQLIDEVGMDYALSFATDKGVSMPHVTLFAGKYNNLETPINVLENFNISRISRKQKIKNMEIWAEKILFLNLLKGKDLQEAHNYFFSNLFPRSSGKPADPQDFKGITLEQQKSFNETGYPFSEQEYLPHFTLAHFQNIPKHKIYREVSLNDILEEFYMGEEINFDKLALFKMGKLGACKEIIYEKDIK
jgi:2'-5' RNA ligase